MNAYKVKADAVNVAVRQKFLKCGRLSRPAHWSTFGRTIKSLDFTLFRTWHVKISQNVGGAGWRGGHSHWFCQFFLNLAMAYLHSFLQYADGTTSSSRKIAQNLLLKKSPDKSHNFRVYSTCWHTLTSFFDVYMCRQKLERVNFEQNWMEEKVVSRRPCRRIFLQTARYEILQRFTNDCNTIAKIPRKTHTDCDIMAILQHKTAISCLKSRLRLKIFTLTRKLNTLCWEYAK